MSKVDNKQKEKLKEKRKAITKEEEKKIRKKTNIIVYFLIILLVFALISGITDYIRFRQNKLPIFAFGLKQDEEELSREYIGLGYKIIKFDNIENNNMKFSSWFTVFSNPSKENIEYNKRKDVNVYKLQILEDLEKITNKVKLIPKDSEKYIKENKDLYNQIKERENTYKYALELILHSEDASQFDKYILAKIVNEKNKKIDFKFKDSSEFIKKYEEYLTKITADKLLQLDEDDLDKIGYEIIFGNPEIK